MAGSALAQLEGSVLASMLLVVPMYLFVYSLSRLSLGVNIILLGISPLLATALSAWFLREPVGWQRWTAVAVGFSGIALVVRPTGEGFSTIYLLPVLVALLVAFRDLLIRRMLAHETSISIHLFSSIVVMLSALPSAAFGWHSLDFAVLAKLAIAGVGVGLGIYFLTDALRFADVSLLAPFKYSGVVWALILGYLLWGEVPTSWVFAGAAVIVLSGLFVLRTTTAPTRGQHP